MTGEGRSTRWLWWLLAATLLALAAFWRIETLDHRPLWFDETWTQRVVWEAQDLGAIWAVGAQDDHQHPPLAYVAAWVAARGAAIPSRLRAPSVVAGLASIGLLAALGSLLFDRWAGLLAAFLASISIYHVDFSQDARPYMLSLTLTLGLYAALLAYFARGARVWLVAFVVCAAGALYTYHLALLHVGVAFVACVLHAIGLWRGGDARVAADRTLASSAAFAAIALAYLPQVANLRDFLSGNQLEPNHVLAVTPAFLDALVQRWGSGRGWTTHLYEAVFVLGAVRLAARRDLTALVVLGWAVAPALVFAILPFSKYFDIRYLISSLPVFFLLTGAGVDGVARGAGRLAASRSAAVRALVAASLALAFLVPAVRLYGTFRESAQRCGDFVRHPEILEANDRLCAEHLLLSSIVAEQQWMLRSLHQRIELDPARLEGYVGTYVFEGGPPIAITRLGDQLVAQLGDQLPNQLVAESETRFWFRVAAISITFERGPGGRFESLVLADQGATPRAHRAP